MMCYSLRRLQVRAVMGDSATALDYDLLQNMTYLDNVLKETLRIRPPLCAVMRKV